MTGKRRSQGFPSRQELVDFIAASPVPLGKRDIAKAFKVRPAERVALKGLLKDITRAGASEHGQPGRPSDRHIIERRPGRRLAAAGTLPEIAVIEVFQIDRDGEALCRTLGADPADPALPRIVLAPGRGEAALGLGARALARLRRSDDGSYAASFLRTLPEQTDRVLGVFTAAEDGGGTLTPTDRRNKTRYRIRPTERLAAETGELVLAAPLPLPRLGLPHAQILERLGRLDQPRSISLVAIHAQGIPTEFSAAALAEAQAARPVALGRRTDLRDLPLVTIDGADARDFDDAVWAEPDAELEGGWHILVAIADVAWYVRPGTALDAAAAERGNSVYFPDRVVPMLPEALSNELCSLKPEVERACLAIHLWLTPEGRVRRHQVVRGLMKSAARLTYEQAQATQDGPPSPLKDRILAPLYGAYRALDAARRERGTLDLDLPERRVVIGEDGAVTGIERRQRLDSHRLIEEFMIAANVAAAETLEQAKLPCMYRVHDAPDPAKLLALQTFLASLEIQGLKLAKGQAVRPHHFSRILSEAATRKEAPLINELVLRAQAQAQYAPENIGHFGLALRRYAHFTSPIRRYADLLVHRALIAGLALGEGGLAPTDRDGFAELGIHISQTERRATQAERSTMDRYVASFLADRVGASFAGRISGVTRFGLFVTLDDTGADGLVPIGTLGRDYWHHDAAHHCLIGERSRQIHTLGDRVEVELAEADPVVGGMVFRLLDSEARDSRAAPRGRRSRR